MLHLQTHYQYRNYHIIQTNTTINVLKIEFEYDSDQGNKLEIYIGVRKVEQNP